MNFADLEKLPPEQLQQVLDFAEVIRSARRPRLGWGNQFRQMAEGGDDLLIDAVPPSLSTWDEEEWSWE